MIDPIENQINEFLEMYLALENFTPGFDRLRSVFSQFNTSLQNSNTQVITIAGTNGKGETAHALCHLLQLEGKKTALWSSPHILSVRERFKVNLEMIGSDELYSLLLKAKVEIGDLGYSYYEFLLYVFCKYIDSLKSIDVLVLEVGLGGRLDTVNLIDADISCVTSISKDHVEFLGDSLNGILLEKLGITRSNKLCVYNLIEDDLRVAARAYCREASVPFEDLIENKALSKDDPYFIRNRFLAYILSERVLGRSVNDYGLLRQKFDYIDFPTLKGRFEKMTLGNNSFIFIGAHNLDGFEKVRDFLNSCDKNRYFDLPEVIDDVLIAFSKREDEEVNGCIKAFQNVHKFPSILKVTNFEHFKALPINKTKELFLNTASIEYVADWKRYLKSIDRNVSKTILVTGSYYFISKVQNELLL